MKRIFLPLCFVLCALCGNAQLQSPDDFLPHKLGENFTPHHTLVAYVEHVAANSPNVRLMRYGHTLEDRPLLLLAVSSPANLARLDQIRQNNLRRAGALEGPVDPSLDVAIVWLGYGVHGNEASGPEAAMGVLHDLANPANAQTQRWLSNTVVLIDPVYNPDGYSRYTHWYRGVKSRHLNPNPSAWEHQEPWPGGRFNHYLFDLNRDWAWQTQLESRLRADIYHQWLPHVHADVHEQGINNPYYFAPAARPYHAYITKWQRDFQTDIGKHIARGFDREGWLYFTREVFDLFYPSYGDTYPTYYGAIGMTYEKAGGGRAGQGILIDNGDTLTLRERVAHHRASSLSTVEVCADNAAALIRNFGEFFERARNSPPGEYKTYIVKSDNPAGKLAGFIDLLDKNRIRYGRAPRAANLRAYNYLTGKEENVAVSSGDLIVSAHQPNGLMAQILMEPRSALEDSLTYDITAWSLPYAHGLRAFAARERIDPSPGYDLPAIEMPARAGNAPPYAYLANWNSMDAARFLSALLAQDLVVRRAAKPFRLEGKAFTPGALIVTRADNRLLDPEALHQKVRDAAQGRRLDLHLAQTGFADEGPDIGSNSAELVAKPRVAIMGGEGTFPTSFGQVWHFFEQELEYPASVIPAQQLAQMSLDDYNVIILSEGRYSIDNGLAERLGNWVAAGGRLIAAGAAAASLEDKKGFALTRHPTEEDKKNAEKEEQQAALDRRLDDYAGQERRSISNDIAGAIFKLKLDNTHPLGYGMPDHYFSLKTGQLSYPPLKGAWNVGTIDDEPFSIGFVGVKAREKMKNSVVFAVENKGRGHVVYLFDNPLFRSFWENGKLLFSNAVFFGG
jgi:hypothetical protein